MKIVANKAPQDIYAVASIPSGTRVQIQNKSSRPFMIYAGDVAPISLDDYFIVDSWVWAEFQGNVIMFWGDFETSIVVQAVT